MEAACVGPGGNQLLVYAWLCCSCGAFFVPLFLLHKGVPGEPAAGHQQQLGFSALGGTRGGYAFSWHCLGAC